MKKILLISIFSILSLYVFISFGQTKLVIEEKKDKSAVENNDFVFYSWRTNPTMKRVTDISAKVREFVWEHWKFQKQGTVQRETYSKEGERSVVTYQIECSENAKCKLSVKIEGEVFGRGTNNSEKSNRIVEYVAESANRIEIPKNYFEKRRKVIDISKEISAKHFLIQLKDENEKIISEF